MYSRSIWTRPLYGPTVTRPESYRRRHAGPAMFTSSCPDTEYVYTPVAGVLHANAPSPSPPLPLPFAVGDGEADPDPAGDGEMLSPGLGAPVGVGVPEGDRSSSSAS